MEIAASARTHGIPDHEIQHAWEHAIRYVEGEHNGEERLLVIGPTTSGSLLELVAVPAAAPVLVIHADVLRPTFYRHLR